MIRVQQVFKRLTNVIVPKIFKSQVTRETTHPIEKQGILQKFPLISNLTICIGFGGLGDFIEQMLENWRKQMPVNNWDMIRTSKFAAAGLSVGFICHYWYLFLDNRFVALTKENLLKKILLCQFVHSPICIIAFFVSIGYLDNWNRSQLIKNIHEKGMLLYQAEWIVWPPALLFSFYFLPTQSRVLFDSLVSLGFDIFNSYLVYNDVSSGKKKKQLIFIKNTQTRNES